MDPDDQKCPHCGKLPTGKKQGKSLPRANVATLGAAHAGGMSRSGLTQDALEIQQAAAVGDDAKGRIKRTKRREARSKKVIVLLSVWLLLMALTVGLVKYFGDEDGEGEDLALIEERARMQREAELLAAKNVIKEALPICKNTLIGFLNATDAAGKAQYVYQGRELASQMSLYYRRNPSFSSVRSQAQIVRAELLKGTKYPTIGAICANQQKELFEAAFVKVGPEWKLDWKFMMRYDDRSWSLFPSGDEGDEGEFRLYMRVRDSNKKFDQEEISLVFYKPQIYRDGEFRGEPSPTVRVPVDSALGRQIIEMAGHEDDMKKDAYGFTLVTLDPPGYHRVRVKMRLHKDGLEKEFELLEILAQHWYGADVLSEELAPADASAADA
ncbi:hypothetical protein JO972_02300 [Verrucomicrobiaceae bacterium 5K15]|uniref:Uncharacterized protein n=1 Tax=Oceaniferula flava TaxID=2800421 RepID=A0AAE2SAE8_9BACT|nr:hypothetical protein [Oceaniferula flavus]MBK1853777.1 hypothetical protein [Oceaniferula flavus]MBM1135084.1 hypothetical protein [Oceaniferula flavus]